MRTPITQTQERCDPPAPIWNAYEETADGPSPGSAFGLNGRLVWDDGVTVRVIAGDWCWFDSIAVRLHPELFDQEARDFLRATGDILGTESCTYIRDVEDSKRLNTRRGSCVIISASGMCETGRIVHHIANNIESPKNTILIVGFQAAYTLGRRLVEKQPHVNIFGKQMKLRAQVVVLNGFSGHADANELRAMLRPLAANCKTAFLVHGEMDQMTALRGTMLGDGFKQVETPARGAEYVLSQ
jgi:metallo-beta-lactamase family protein